MYKILLILNEEARAHYDLQEIFKSFHKKYIFIQFLYLHTNSHSLLLVPHLSAFFENSKADSVFVLLQPISEKEFVKPELFIKNIESIERCLPDVTLNLINPFRPKFSTFSSKIEYNFCQALNEKRLESSGKICIHRSTLDFDWNWKPHFRLECFSEIDIFKEVLKVCRGRKRNEEIRIKNSKLTRKDKIRMKKPFENNPTF